MVVHNRYALKVFTIPDSWTEWYHRARHLLYCELLSVELPVTLHCDTGKVARVAFWGGVGPVSCGTRSLQCMPIWSTNKTSSSSPR